MGTYLFFAGFSIMLIDMRDDISVLYLFGFLSAIVGYIFYYLGLDENFHSNDAQSAIQSIKALFEYKTSKELEDTEYRLQSI